ncbi:MAG: NAD(P)-dependent oxidoreductase [Rhodoferax sp.]|nr:NAD(P)-dependent oxidoreductase [Rhodoferax sp.]
MRVLLTGASGFLGRYVLRSLRQQGIQTVVLGRWRPPECLEVDFIQADLLTSSNLSAMVQASRASHLLHLAWFAEHGVYWTSPLNLRWVEASVRLVEAFCAHGGQQVVLAGSCAEYDWTEGYCREDHTSEQAATLYGTAKDATRRLVMAICAQHQVPCAWGRVFLPFGAGEGVQRLIPSLISVFRGQRPAFGVNASAYRDFLHASDVAQAFVTLLTRGASGAFNVSSGQPTLLADLVRTLANLLGADAQAVLDLATTGVGEPRLLVGANDKLQALGWQPAMSLAKGLRTGGGG